jgi:hypothetical protein
MKAIFMIIFVDSQYRLQKCSLNVLNFVLAYTSSPSITLWPETVATPPQGEREAKPLSLDGREVGERVVVKQLGYLIVGSIKSFFRSNYEYQNKGLQA